MSRKLAGVSTATVSYVLNGSRSISEKTRKCVLDAVEQLNYKPDMIARSMTKNETMQLSLMINDITNPFYSEIVMGFEAAAIEKGYFVNVCTGYKDINNYSRKLHRPAHRRRLCRRGTAQVRSGQAL